MTLENHNEDDLLPISALAQIVFCERRCALIHLEGAWEDNIATTQGSHLHERAHEEGAELRGDLLIVRALRLRSLHIGITGQADVVEFHRQTETGAVLPGRTGFWRPFPVEYKRGHSRPEPSFLVQLCAQALCLEEMLHTDVLAGALFFGKERRRLDVAFDFALRLETQQTAERLHALFRSRQTPPARYEKKCQSCSLIGLCRPRETGGNRRVAQWLEKTIGKDT
jgi:CRISPR-associated exonuclease Cas4